MPNQSRKLFALALQPGDPRRLLSSEARIRIDNTLNQQEALRRTAEVLALQLPPRAAARERSAARMEAAVLVLEAELREFVAIGKSGAELQAIMDQEFEVAEGGLELTAEECNAVRSRLFAIRFALEERLEPIAPAPIEEPVPAKKQTRREAHPNAEPIAPAPIRETATSTKPRKKLGRPKGIEVDTEELKRLRKLTNLDQTALATRCDIVPHTLQNAESGRVSKESLAKIARGLTKELGRDVTVAELKAKPK
jgi:DNA-binding XRE family transcriptional regulator